MVVCKQLLGGSEYLGMIPYHKHQELGVDYLVDEFHISIINFMFLAIPYVVTFKHMPVNN